MAAAVVGMERIALWIGRCAVYEQLYFMGGVSQPVPEIARSATDGLHNALIALYISILQVLGRLIKIFNGTSRKNALQITTS